MTIGIYGADEALFHYLKSSLSTNEITATNNTSNVNYLVLLPTDDLISHLQKNPPPTTTKVVLLNLVSSLIDSPVQLQTVEEVFAKLTAIISNIRLLTIIDPYTLDPQNKYQTKLDYLLLDSIKAQSFSTTPSGDRQYYPTHLKDGLNALVRSLFMQNTNKEHFVVCGETYSDLELGYLLQKTQNDKKIDLKLDGSSGYDFHKLYEQVITTQAKLNWVPQNDLASILKKLKILTTSAEPVPETINPTTPPSIKLESLALTPKSKNKLKPLNINLHTFEKKSLQGSIKFVTALFLVSILLPLITSILAILGVAKLSQDSLISLNSGQIQSSKNQLEQALIFKWVSDQTASYLLTAVNLFSSDSGSVLNNSLLAIDHTLKLLKSSQEVYDIGNSLYLATINKSNQKVSDLTVVLKLNLSQINDQLGQLQLLLDHGAGHLFGHSFIRNQSLQQIKQIRSHINQISPSLDLFLEIAKDQNPKRILVLTQDPNEYRASGGYLNTVSLLTLKEGIITDIQTESSLNIDKLIEGQVEPPKIITSLLGEDNWHFRDANTNADFAESAKQIRWFYNRFKGISVDGVVGLNTYLIGKYLDNNGKITSPQYQSLNSETLYQNTSNSTQDNKEDYLTSLTNDTFKQFLQGNIDIMPIFKTISDLVSYGEINLWFADDNLQSFARASSLSGEITTPPCHPQISQGGCLSSFLYLNESNFSLAKTNLYQQRSENSNINISDQGTLTHQYRLNIKYPTPAPITTSKSYKAYYQLYLSPNITNFSLKIDNQEIDPELIVHTQNSTGNKYEFSTNLMINQDHELLIDYQLSETLDLKKPLVSYTFDWLKQPGTLKQSRELSINYPPQLEPKAQTVQFDYSQAGVALFKSQFSAPVSAGTLFKNTSL